MYVVENDGKIDGKCSFGDISFGVIQVGNVKFK